MPMIGIFDSGIGGLIVAKAVMKALPHEPIIYIGDMARLPYGNKSKAAIIEYTIECVGFLVSHGANVIVIGCNSASSVALLAVRKKFAVPIFGVIDPAVLAALNATKNNRIGVVGTRATIGSGIYKKKLLAKNKNVHVFENAAPLLVPLIEEEWGATKPAKEIIATYCAPLKKANVDTLILGCTHYPALMAEIQKAVGKNVHLISSADAVAHTLKSFLKRDTIGASRVTPKASRFYVTDRTPFAERVAKTWLQQPITLKLVHL